MANDMLNESLGALRDVRRSELRTPLTFEDVIVKAGLCLTVVVTAAIPGWIFLSGAPIVYLALIIGMLVFGFVIARRAPIPAPLALGYSAGLGFIVGAFSKSAALAGGGYELIPQAVLGTIGGAVGMIVLYSTPFGKKASKSVKLFAGIALGYLVIGLLSLVGALFGVGNGWGFYGVGGLGLLLCLAGVALAAWSFLIDLGQTSEAVSAGVPQTWSWTFGVSITSSLVWMYLEILRLLAIIRQ